ncbi:hypothetical protein [Naumannella cuiyingiana]|uniref:Phage terminase large subunit-like protein n=1 Tax=Naumannella cuiyingiana TaxID=1347891 RepID=A0A7Z0D646_9ACTN|nr:hypothetical protein [Naumannella cuiyingiana]NYI69569.1 phage terminase large subunit-like protein [Naumannella cuiyingiana]
MIRNVVLLGVGAVAGVLVFRWARRKVDAVIAETRPDAVVARVARGAQHVGNQIADFADDVLINTRRRESEIRAELGMAPVVEQIDPEPAESLARRRA